MLTICTFQKGLVSVNSVININHLRKTMGHLRWDVKTGQQYNQSEEPLSVQHPKDRKCNNKINEDIQ